MTPFTMIVICIVVFILLILFYKYGQPKINSLSIKESMDKVDLPVITVWIEGKEFNLIIDTGSNLSFMDKAALEGIEYLESKQTKDIVTAQGGFGCNSCELDFEYKNTFFTETFYLAPLSESFSKVRDDTGISIHGILGNSFLTKYGYVIDFDKFIIYNKV